MRNFYRPRRSIMSPDVRIVVLYNTILLLVGFSEAHTELCSFPLNCNVETICFIGSSCVCPLGYARLSMCEGMGIVAEECHEYMEEGFICYPENACLGPHEKWTKNGLLSLVCVREDNSVHHKVRRYDGNKMEYLAKANPFLVLFAVVVFILRLIYWAMEHDKKGNKSEKQRTQTV